MTLPIKKVYIDSRFRTADSASNSDFKFELSQSIQLPANCVCYVDDIQIPHSWYSIEDFNNKMYFRHLVSAVQTDKILSITIQNHTGTTLATSIKSQLDVAYGSGVYDVTYNDRKGTLTVSTGQANTTFMIITDKDLASNVWATWNGPAYNNANPQSMNGVLRNEGDSLSDAASYESGFLDLLNIHNLYIYSPNIGSFSTLGPRGECNIIKKVPVSSSYGYAIFDNVVAPHDSIDVSRQLLKTLEFRLSSASGDLVPLHGSNWSCSLIFSITD